MKKLWLISAVFLLPLTAQAQSIDIGELGAASAYDVALLEPAAGGLDSALWQGTSARMAAHLVKTAPLSSDNPIVQDLVRAAILSGGVPPEAANPEMLNSYNAARLTAVMALGDKTMLETLVSRSPGMANDPVIAANMALASGDAEGACHVADGVSEGRGSPQWARLRAFCHVIRDEAAAAELTSELLKNSGYEDPTYFSLLNVLTGASRKAKLDAVGDDPIYAVMADAAHIKWPDGQMPASIAAKIALDGSVRNDTRLKALYKAGSVLTNEQMGEVLSSFTYDEADPAGMSFDFESIRSSSAAKSCGQLYTLVKAGGSAEQSAKAAGELLKRADKNEAFASFANLLASDISIIPGSIQAGTDTALFTRAAIQRGDIGTLQGLYGALDGNPVQHRIALVSDAIGNGFMMGALGKDIEEGLMGQGSEKRRAVRDTVIALALGAQLSDEAALAMTDNGVSTGKAAKPGDILALRAASKAGSRAETALRAAAILESAGSQPLDNLSLHAVIQSLSDAGLIQFAGRVAANDFARDMG